MDKVYYDNKMKRLILYFLLSVYSLYSIIMVVLSVERGWDSYVSLMLLSVMFISWIVCLIRYIPYEFKAKFVAIAMQLALLFYCFHIENIASLLPVAIGFIIFLGIFGIPKIVCYSVIPTALMFLYHGFIVKSIPFSDLQEKLNLLVQICNIYIITYIVYVWAKSNKEGSEKLVDAIKELKGVERSKDDFLASVSHEIRTPINTICGISEIVLKEELPDNIKTDLRGIQQAGRNLMSVVRDILDFSELQSGKIDLEEETYNIASTINDVINMSMARISDKKIELIVDCDVHIPSGLLGDEKKIRRIIMNLVDNAIKFTDEGFIRLKIGCRREAYGANLIIGVKDTGAGMDEEYMERLFVGFNQMDANKRRKESGVGLGLPICYQLSKKMGAAITLKSELGKGTDIQVVIPQKVVEEEYIAVLQNKSGINVAVYIDSEKFDMIQVRDEYAKSILSMAEQLKRKCHICKNFAELQRREQSEKFSHVFISAVEYKADKEYFDELAKRVKVVVVLYRSEEKYITNPNILKVYKPFYILTIVSVLNGLYDSEKEVASGSAKKFITKNVRVLVVDDNRMNIRVIEGLLKDYKIDVTIALSGKEALEKIEEANFDFVFMDHMMPEMDGIEALQKIRQKVGTFYHKVPVIALTANAVAGTREMFLQNGFNDFLEKPVEKSVLERVLKRNISPDKIVYGNETYVEEIYSDTEEITEKELGLILEPKGIDVKKGIVYCNGIESYIDVIKGYCLECNTSDMLLERLYEKNDWKNYTIEVHGIKSAMRSIGATEISESAAKLEAAGLSDNIDYIRHNHESLVVRYKELFNALCNDKSGMFVAKEEATLMENEETETFVIEEAEFLEILSQLEEAMYTLDGELMKEKISFLQNGEYNGKRLKSMLNPVARKIEMSDYVSAVDMLVKIKSELSGKEE